MVRINCLIRYAITILLKETGPYSHCINFIIVKKFRKIQCKLHADFIKTYYNALMKDLLGLHLTKTCKYLSEVRA